MPKSKAKTSRYASYSFRFIVAGAALYLAFRGEDPGQVVKVLLGLNLWTFAAALGLYIIGQFIFAFRWNLLLRVQSIHIGFWPALRLHFLGLFYTHCLPSSVGGDLLRAWYVTKHTDKKLEAALSVFVDRAVGLTGMIIMAFCCYWFIPAEGSQNAPGFSYEINFFERIRAYKWPVLGILAVFVLSIAVFALSRRGRTLLQRSFRFAKDRGLGLLSKVRKAIGIYWNRKPTLLCALFLTFCLQSLCIIAMWLIGREIGVTAHIKYYFIFFPISWLLGALPISIGGAGIMELWLKDMFIRVGAASSENSLVLALCQRFLWLLGSLPGVVIHLAGAHVPKDFSIDYNQSEN